MTNSKNIRGDVNIAYLAPEIPALSATFVYQEILELKNLGVNITPISIHRPTNKAQGDALNKLEQETYYLYEQSSISLLFHNLYIFLSSPIKYFSVFWMAIKDSFSIGLTTHAGKGVLYRFFIAAGLVKNLKTRHVSHIHSNFAHIPTDIAMYAASIQGITFSFTSHANDLFERGWLLQEKVARSKFAVTISKYNKEFLIGKGCDPLKINIIHCGVNTNSFSLKGSCELSNPPMIGALGRMVEKKGFDVLIKACKYLKNEGLTFSLQIAGGGPLSKELEGLAKSLNLSDSIHFIDSIPHKDVPNWIKSLDVFVLPCKKDNNGDMDGIPVVLMEAMLSGVPVISSRISGIPELVIDQVTGLLCEENDEASLARKIKLVITDAGLKDGMCKRAVDKVKSEFELRNNVNMLAELLLNE